MKSVADELALSRGPAPLRPMRLPRPRTPLAAAAAKADGGGGDPLELAAPLEQAAEARGRADLDAVRALANLVGMGSNTTDASLSLVQQNLGSVDGFPRSRRASAISTASRAARLASARASCTTTASSWCCFGC